jgi:hypothetical protein
MDEPSFKDTIAEALAELIAASGETPDQLFGDGTAFTRDWSGSAARACGLIEGAAMALDVSVLELLWSLGLAN